MPGDLLGELIKPFVELACYWTGKPIVRILSLGRLHVALVDPDQRGKRERRWSSLTFSRGGRRYLDAEVVMLVGMIFCAPVVVAIVVVVRR